MKFLLNTCSNKNPSYEIFYLIQILSRLHYLNNYFQYVFLKFLSKSKIKRVKSKFELYQTLINKLIYSTLLLFTI